MLKTVISGMRLMISYISSELYFTCMSWTTNHIILPPPAPPPPKKKERKKKKKKNVRTVKNNKMLHNFVISAVCDISHFVWDQLASQKFSHGNI